MSVAYAYKPRKKTDGMVGDPRSGVWDAALLCIRLVDPETEGVQLAHTVHVIVRRVGGRWTHVATAQHSTFFLCVTVNFLDFFAVYSTNIIKTYLESHKSLPMRLKNHIHFSTQFQ